MEKHSYRNVELKINNVELRSRLKSISHTMNMTTQKAVAGFLAMAHITIAYANFFVMPKFSADVKKQTTITTSTYKDGEFLDSEVSKIDYTHPYIMPDVAYKIDEMTEKQDSHLSYKACEAVVTVYNNFEKFLFKNLKLDGKITSSQRDYEVSVVHYGQWEKEKIFFVIPTGNQVRDVTYYNFDETLITDSKGAVEITEKMNDYDLEQLKKEAISKQVNQEKRKTKDDVLPNEGLEVYVKIIDEMTRIINASYNAKRVNSTIYNTMLPVFSLWLGLFLVIKKIKYKDYSKKELGLLYENIGYLDNLILNVNSYINQLSEEEKIKMNEDIICFNNLCDKYEILKKELQEILQYRSSVIANRQEKILRHQRLF